MRTNIVMLFSAFILTGCATKLPDADPLPADARNQLGTIAITTSQTYASLGGDLKSPVGGAGSAALIGAGQGALGSLAGGAESNSPYGLALGILLAAPAGVVGGVVGAARAHSSAQVKETEAAIRETLDATRPGSELTAQIRAAAAREVPQYLIGDAAITAPTNAAEEKGEAGGEAETADHNARLELVVEGPEFVSVGRIDPDVSFTLQAHATLEVPNINAGFQRCWLYSSRPANYFALGANHGERLSSDLQTAYSKLAERIVHDLLIVDHAEKFDSPGAGKAVRSRSPGC